jgi:hypothetical protein
VLKVEIYPPSQIVLTFVCSNHAGEEKLYLVSKDYKSSKIFCEIQEIGELSYLNFYVTTGLLK